MKSVLLCLFARVLCGSFRAILTSDEQLQIKQGVLDAINNSNSSYYLQILHEYTMRQCMVLENYESDY